MSARLVALYRIPQGQRDVFLEHYHTVHRPLAEALPGLRDMVVTGVREHIEGEADVSLIAVMTFPDRATLQQALESPEGRAAGRDLRGFADGLVTLLVTEDEP